MKVGDRVRLKDLISEDPKDWFMTEGEFLQVKAHVGKIGTVTHIQKHFVNKEKTSYFLDIKYSSGYRLKRVNRLAFEAVEFDFDYI
tara:strand:- start:1507 stop:1764 length:258 start_codon:yes stop_codon:yes gene_type:complete